jgi:hypothetical protein
MISRMTSRQSKGTMTLICCSQSFPVQKEVLLKQLALFQGRPGLIGQDSYRIEGDVSAEFVPEFIRAIHGERVRVSAPNVYSLSALCDEFGFRSLAADCESFLEHNPNRVPNLLLFDTEERITHQGCRAGCCSEPNIVIIQLNFCPPSSH